MTECIKESDAHRTTRGEEMDGLKGSAQGKGGGAKEKG